MFLQFYEIIVHFISGCVTQFRLGYNPLTTFTLLVLNKTTYIRYAVYSFNYDTDNPYKT